MWSGDLIDISEVSEVYRGEDVFIRLPASSLGLTRDSSSRNRLTGYRTGLNHFWCNHLGPSIFHNLEEIKEKSYHTTVIRHMQGNLPTGQEIAVKRLSKG
ncbi:hypothetical protein F3Y22_tig00111445pilonHSYRG00107 [Hibiscus syriacus]|uniref:Uncharacterized protein n=1 Tax=Hibiscus syriacus TaxID=106335 RepID=A0A6A2XR59_HIBSY|nr:hypothetical protein F3Y22_tig00111445pilonHSYRG00107 [Hibiscus syriacus]